VLCIDGTKDTQRIVHACTQVVGYIHCKIKTSLSSSKQGEKYVNKIVQNKTFRMTINTLNQEHPNLIRIYNERDVIIARLQISLKF
jgi:hypothetical protein